MENIYFSVGEEVLLRSSSCPELNCACIVTRVFSGGEEIIVYGEVMFFTEDDLAYSIGVSSDGLDLWAQSALRKKHPPAELSFSELMNSLMGETV